jgi:hypothetical protein
MPATPKPISFRLVANIFGLVLIISSIVTWKEVHAEVSRKSLTLYPNLRQACVAFVTGYRQPATGNKLVPTLGSFRGECADRKKPFVVGVTQENARNNHNGSANYNPNISSYMSDFDPDDIGSWLDLELFNSDTPPRVLLRLDTATFQKINVTGWPLQYGHMFLGLSDPTVLAPLDSDVTIEFELKIHDGGVSKTPSSVSYNGRRVLVGASGNWPESAPRTNSTHYLEINVDQTTGFSDSYSEPRYPLCQDITYDRCFYGDGQFPEGREISYQSILNGAPLTEDWTHIKIDLARTFRRLRWVSPPTDWSVAKLNGLYIGIEATGATNTTVELRNYNVYNSK